MMVKPVILCIDDESIILRSLRQQILRGIGDNYQIEIAESGQEALEFCAELRDEGVVIPLIICDHFLPCMLGDEILSRLHALYPETLKILLTGQASFEGVVRAINQANLYRYIAKPWNETDLILTVKEALRSYEQGQKIKNQNQILQKINQQLQQEIQERKRTEHLLKISEARLESILNSSEDVIWSISPDSFELLYLSPSIEKLYGEPVQRFWQNPKFWRHDVVYAQDRETLKNFISQVLTKNSLTIEYRICPSTGEIKWLKERAQVIYDEVG